MDEETSHAHPRWWIWVVIALVVYVASESPLRHWCEHHGYGARRLSTQWGPAGIDHIAEWQVPAWHWTVYRPVNWMNLYERGPMKKYDEFWAATFP